MARSTSKPLMAFRKSSRSVSLSYFEGQHLTLSYLIVNAGASGGGKNRTQLFVDSLAFSLGLATTLAVLGIGASLAGKAYGQIGQGIPIAVSVVAMVMGLNLLEVWFLKKSNLPVYRSPVIFTPYVQK